MKKRKLRLKKEVWAVLVVLLFLGIGVYAFRGISKDNEIKKTIEYKLGEKGYSNDEIKLLKEKLQENDINSLVNIEKNQFLLEIINEKYFVYNNLNRYLEFQKKYTTFSPAEVVKRVNVNLDYDFYDYDNKSDIGKDILVLVNKFYHLESDYDPSDLVNVNNKYFYGSDHKLRKDAYQAFIKMWDAAKEEDIYLIITSSYRSYESQVKAYDNIKDTQGTTKADKVVARPGYSEYQTGLALDIFSKEDINAKDFSTTKTYTWLIDNAYRFGFILRYPTGTSDITGFMDDTSHFRYVGVEAATYIYENNITFDEYYAYFGK